MESLNFYLCSIILIITLISCTPIQRTEVGVRQNFEMKLDSLGVKLQAPSPPVANYVNAVRTGNLIFLAGKGPKDDNGKNITGRLGEDLSIEQGYKAARQIGIAQLSVLKNELGDLNKVIRIVKVLGFVQCTDDFMDQPKVINGFSDLMVEVFGDKGKHARAAVGTNALPGGICAEIEMIVEIKGDK